MFEKMRTFFLEIAYQNGRHVDTDDITSYYINDTDPKFYEIKIKTKTSDNSGCVVYYLNKEFAEDMSTTLKSEIVKNLIYLISRKKYKKISPKNVSVDDCFFSYNETSKAVMEVINCSQECENSEN